MSSIVDNYKGSDNVFDYLDKIIPYKVTTTAFCGGYSESFDFLFRNRPPDYAFENSLCKFNFPISAVTDETINQYIYYWENVIRLNGIPGPLKNIKFFHYVWKKRGLLECPSRIRLNDRPCVVIARGKMNSVKIHFLDNREQHIVSRFALRTI